MEKHQDTHEDTSFSVHREITWRDSLEESNIPFKDVIPALKEYDESQIK